MHGKVTILEKEIFSGHSYATVITALCRLSQLSVAITARMSEIMCFYFLNAAELPILESPAKYKMSVLAHNDYCGRYMVFTSKQMGSIHRLNKGQALFIQFANRCSPDNSSM